MKGKSKYNKFVTISNYSQFQLNRVHEQMDRIRAITPEESKNKFDEELIRTAFEWIFERKKYVKTAQVIFDQAKNIIEAEVGYLAIFDMDNEEVEIILSDAGKTDHRVKDPDGGSAPLRGLRKLALHTQKAIHVNDFAASKYATYLPEGHLSIENIIISPMIIHGYSQGLIALANKAGDFSHNDICLLNLFAEMSAMALENSHAWSYLGKMESRYFRTSEYHWAEEVM